MATSGFPTISTNAYWAVRNLFKKSLPTQVTVSYLSAALHMKDKSARQVYSALQQIGILDEEGVPTERGADWRMDDEYAEVCHNIVEDVYPDELRQIAPDPAESRNVAVRWFMKNQQVGEGTAKNYARTYALLTEGDPSGGEGVRPGKKKGRKPKKTSKQTKQSTASPTTDEQNQAAKSKREAAGQFPLHIDVQVHISPEASANQIDQIFESMAKHLSKLQNGTN